MRLTGPSVAADYAVNPGLETEPCSIAIERSHSRPDTPYIAITVSSTLSMGHTTLLKSYQSLQCCEIMITSCVISCVTRVTIPGPLYCPRLISTRIISLPEIEISRELVLLDQLTVRPRHRYAPLSLDFVSFLCYDHRQLVEYKAKIGAIIANAYLPTYLPRLSAPSFRFLPIQNLKPPFKHTRENLLKNSNLSLRTHTHTVTNLVIFVNTILGLIAITQMIQCRK